MVRWSFIIVLVLSGCNFRRNTVDTTNDEVPFTGPSMGYNEIKNQILSPYCLSCHSGKHDPLLTTYSGVVAALGIIQHSVLSEKSMPKSRALSGLLRGALRAWINEGAPEVATGPFASPTPGIETLPRPILFSDFKARVLVPSCVSCHTQGNKDGLTSMEDYKSVKSVVDLLSPLMTGKMGDVVVPDDQRMPPPKSPALPDDQLKLLEYWLQDGAREK